MQKVKMIAGVVVATFGALLSIPILSRYWSGDALTIATIAILAHSLFGIIDIFRPIIVRRAIADAAFPTLANVLLPSLGFGLVCAAVIAILGYMFGESRYGYLVASVALSALIFCAYSPFWACMDSMLRMGEAYLIRSISVGLLYAVIAIGSKVDEIAFVYVGLVGVNLIAGLWFWIGGRRALVPGGLSINRSYIKESIYLGFQNLSKMVNDFGDRLMSSFYLPVSLAGLYNVSSDMAGRVNVPSQIASTYYYPVICKERDKVGLFFSIGILVSFLILAFAVFFYGFGSGLFTLYFGPGKRDIFPVFCALLAVFGVYSLSFFGQVILRSLALDGRVLLSFLIPSLAGSLLAVFYIISGEVTTYRVVMAALIFKSSSILLMISLFSRFPIRSSLGIFSVILSYAFVFHIVF